MLRRSLVKCGLAAALLIGLASTSVRAEEEPPGSPETPKLTEAVRRGWFRAAIVSGRFIFSGARMANMNAPAKPGEREERLSVQMVGQGIAVNYQTSWPDEELAVEVTGGNQLTVRRTPKGDSSLEGLEFRQPAEGFLWLAAGPKEKERVWRARSLWHLFVMEPKTCQERLIPVLALLNPHWDLSKTARQVESALARAAAGGELPDPRRWALLVEQLGDSRFSRREEADRELRSLGRGVLTYLERLDPSQLDAEQHYRVRRIVHGLSANMENDTPGEIAGWLAGDPAIWLAMLARDDESTRRLAAEWLEALLGQSIAFDPAGDATTRAAQIERLRARIVDE